jgi:hypothetical protein
VAKLSDRTILKIATFTVSTLRQMMAQFHDDWRKQFALYRWSLRAEIGRRQEGGGGTSTAEVQLAFSRRTFHQLAFPELMSYTLAQMEELWVITAEILVKPGDLASGDTKAFVNIVTWADSPSTAEEKLSRCLESYEWHLIGIEAAHPFDEARSYGDELIEIVEQARTNPQACIIGTAFSYKPE